MKKRITFCAITALVMIVLVGPVITNANTEDIRVFLDGEILAFDVPPQIINGRTMVPFRVIFEALGASVEWEEEFQQISARENFGRGLVSVHLTIGQGEMFVETRVDNSNVPMGVAITGLYSTTERVALDIPPQIVDNRTLVPLRSVSQSLGAEVDWCGDSRVVTITSAANSVPTTATTLPKEISGNFETQLFVVMPTNENYMISPFSLRMALAMAANGATADSVSRSELLAALDIDDLDEFNRAASEFITTSNANEEVEFNIANSIWFNEDRFPGVEIGFRGSYERIIRDYFAGIAENVTAETAADIINSWISEQTRNRINDVVAEEMFGEDSEIIAVLVNAIYFKGDWANPFNENATRDEIFTDRNGIETMIPMMNMTRFFSYYENEYFQMLAKPYEDENIRMYFVLPRGDERLPFSMFEDAIGNMGHRDVRFRLPRFRTEFLHDNLVEILQGMGVERAFEVGHFDFWDMVYPTYVGGEPLWVWIEEILQKTFIEVDEEGTEAAAATAIFMGARAASIPPPPIDFICDRPFIYFIRNDVTGDILFMGEFAFAE